MSAEDESKVPDPTPAELEQRKREVQATWSEVERLKRLGKVFTGSMNRPSERIIKRDPRPLKKRR